MMRCSAVVMILSAALATVGCAPSHEQAVDDSHQRWYDARAGVLITSGEAQFRTGDMDAAAASGREALSLAPDMIHARMLLARVAIEKGRFTEAIEHLAEIGRREPEDARVPYLQAVVDERRGRYQQALRLYDKARALDSGNPAYVVAAAEVLVALNRADEALGLVEAKLTNIDESADVYVLAGDLAMLVGRPDRACGHYRQARYLNPTDNETLEKFAKAVFFAGDYARAATRLKDLAKREPYHEYVWVHTMLGEAALAAGRPREAKAAYQRVTELAETDPKAWVNLATASLACNDLSRAVLSARRALRLDAQSAEASAVLAYALLAQGKSAEAQQMLIKAARTHPSDPMLACLLGRSYSAMGRTDEALAHYQITLRLDPDNFIAREMVSQLTQ